MERPFANCVDVSFADDNTQVIMYPLRSKEILAARTISEIKRINDYEEKWKIKTNKAKFQLLSISATKPNEIVMEQQRIPFTNKAKVLGMEISTRGVVSHMKTRLNLAKQQFTKLKRFKNMNTKIQIQFYKMIIRQIMEYPAIPLCITSKSNVKKMQQFQNKVLRTATRENGEDNRLSISELHTKYKIDAVNIRLYRLASKVWTRLTTTNEDLVTESQQQNEIITTNDHYWWRRISPYICGGEPHPNYAENHM